MVRVALMVVALLLCAQAAQAGSPADLVGELTFGGPVEMAGDATVSAPEGLLDLAPGLLAGQELDLGWTHASGYRYDEEFYYDPWTRLNAPPQGARTSLEWGEGGIEGLRCENRCTVFAFAEGDGRLGLTGDAKGVLPWDATGESYWTLWNESDATDAFAYSTGAGWLRARSGAGSHALPLADGAPFASGNISLLIWNATGTIVAEGEREALRTGYTRAPVGPRVGFDQPESIRNSFVLLRLSGAALSAPPGTDAILVAPQVEVQVEGVVSFPSSAGWIRLDGHHFPVEGQPVLVDGLVQMPLSVTAADLVEMQDVRVAADDAAAASLSGSASAVQVAGKALTPYTVANAGEAAIAGGALLALLAAAWLLLERGAFATLFSRIGRHEILENDNRRALHNLIREQPGLTTAQLSRQLNIPRVVVTHHMRMLEAHRLVASHRQQRGPRFYPPENLPDAAASRALEALRDGTRHQVAALLARTPGGLTQRDLAGATALSQRLVSYHLKRLETTGLVEGHGAMPRRYEATEALREALAQPPEPSA